MRAAAISIGAMLCACRPSPPDRPREQPAVASRDVAAILAASNLPAELPTPISGDPMAVTVHRLSNGMTV